MISGKDVFILYSDKDNDPADKRGWLYNFWRFLNLLLSRLSGKSLEIQLIEEGQLDLDAIYNTSTILIPVVSPGLLRSSHFNEEIKRFHEKAINKEFNNISWNTRIFKVVRYPLQEHYLLDYLNNSVNYNFYHVDNLTDEVIHYDDFTGPKSEKTFWLRLYDLAYDLHKIIDKISNSDNEIQQLHKDINAQYIYLANVGSDMADVRDVIKRELLRSGYQVLPESNLPDDEETAKKLIKRDLNRCCLSIHIVGSDFGQRKKADFSIVELQNTLAADHIKSVESSEDHVSLHFGRIIWISTNLVNINVKQRLFIDKLRKDHHLLYNTELMETGVEELKTYILEKLSGHQYTESSKSTNAAPESKIIYLICDKEGLSQCSTIKEMLELGGHRVLLSKLEGNPNEIRHEHNQNLKTCDATLIYCKNTNDEWVRSKVKDLLKSLGLGREKPINPQAIIVDNESKIEEMLGLSDDALVLHNSGVITADVIEPFLTKLNQL